MLKQLKKSNEGFTIIEVMIVLAIAGLILLIVFLAVPALQRNARNTTLKNDASAIAGGITEYVSNNNGAQPTAFVPAAPVSPSITIGAAGSAQVIAKVNGSTTVTTVAAVPTAANVGTGTIKVYWGHDCSGVANARQSAVFYGIEAAGGQVVTCIAS